MEQMERPHRPKVHKLDRHFQLLTGYNFGLVKVYVADLSHLDDLQRLVAEFGDLLHRDYPHDNALVENLRRLLEAGEAEFLLAADHTREAVGYIQQTLPLFPLDWWSGSDTRRPLRLSWQSRAGCRHSTRSVCHRTGR